jgi:Phage integrase family
LWQQCRANSRSARDVVIVNDIMQHPQGVGGTGPAQAERRSWLTLSGHLAAYRRSSRAPTLDGVASGFGAPGRRRRSDPVFVSGRREGKALTERAIGYIVKAAARRAGVNPAASVNWLRHTHASHAIDNGAPITLVSQMLGHADLKTISVYAHAKPGESSGPISEDPLMAPRLGRPGSLPDQVEGPRELWLAVQSKVVYSDIR